MKYLLDSDICIYYLNRRHPTVASKLTRNPPSSLGIPAIVKGELLLGARKSAVREKVMNTLTVFLSAFRIIPFGDGESAVYARVRSELEAAGSPIGPNDLLIAATALAHGATLVTHNLREFGKVKGLALEDWTE